jgi:hypothetical protein
MGSHGGPCAARAARGGSRAALRAVQCGRRAARWPVALALVAISACPSVTALQHRIRVTSAAMLGCGEERVAVTDLRTDGSVASWRTEGCHGEAACSGSLAAGGEQICVKGAGAPGPSAEPSSPAATPSLAIPVRFPGSVEVLRSGLGAGDDRLEVTALVPGDAPPLDCALVVWDKDGRRWESEPRPCPAAAHGAAATLGFDLAAGLVPVNHSAPLLRHELRDVERAGVRIGTYRRWAGTIRVHPLATARAPARPLAIERVRLPEGQVAVHGIAEIEVELSRDFDDPFDPGELEVSAKITTPSGRTIVQPGYFHQEFTPTWGGGPDLVAGLTAFRVRFSPREPGRHVFRISVRAGAEAVESPAYALEADGRERPGALPPIQIAADGRSFAKAGGEPFYPIGHNLHSPGPLFDRASPPLAQGGLSTYEEVFERMAAAGENLAEIWMSPWWLALEWNRSWPGYHGLGRYDLEHAWLLDRLLEAAARRGIYVNLVLDNHGMYSSFCDAEWSASPYRTANGGFLESPDEFFTDPRAFDAYRNRLRYVLARWGAHSNVMALTFLSEIDLTGSRKGNSRRSAVVGWLRRTSRFVRDNDAHGHLLTVHFSGDFGNVDPRIAADGSIDFLALDAYRGRETPFPELARRTASALAPYGKPFLVTEYGSHPRTDLREGRMAPGADRELESELRAGLWSSWLTPAAGAPLFWYFDLVHRKDLYRHYAAFHAFTEGESRLGSGAWETSVQAAPDGVEIVLYGDASGGWGWAYDRAHLASGAETGPPSTTPTRPGAGFSLRGRPGARYRIEYWDTFAGRPVGSEQATAGGDGRIVASLPAFGSDVAFKWRALERDPTAPARASAPGDRAALHGPR